MVLTSDDRRIPSIHVNLDNSVSYAGTYFIHGIKALLRVLEDGKYSQDIFLMTSCKFSYLAGSMYPVSEGLSPYQLLCQRDSCIAANTEERNGTAVQWQNLASELQKVGNLSTLCENKLCSAKLLGVVLAMAAVYLIGALGTLFYNRAIAKIGQKVLKETRDDLFVKMQTFPISFFDSHTHGDIMSVYTNDTDTLRQFIAQSLPVMISSLVTIVFVFCFMLRFNLILTGVVVVLSAVMILVARIVVRYSGKYFAKQQDSTGAVNGYIEEMFGGLKVVKVFCHEEAAKARLRELNEELYINTLKANGAAGALMPIMSGFGNVQYLVVAIVGGAMALFGDGMFSTTLGTLISFLGLIRQFTSSITQTAQQMNSAVLGFAGASRIFELMDNEPEKDDGYVTLVRAKEQNGKLVECADGDIYAWKHPHHDGTLTYTKVQGNVVLDHVDFSYDGRKLVLHDISLYAKPGQKIAFVGATGAGKTTITNLINRFYDLADGKIRYDGINITKIRKTDLRRSMGIILQDVNLFTGTVMDNIRYGKLDATDEECIAAAKLSGADSFFLAFPMGIKP